MFLYDSNISQMMLNSKYNFPAKETRTVRKNDEGKASFTVKWNVGIICRYRE